MDRKHFATEVKGPHANLRARAGIVGQEAFGEPQRSPTQHPREAGEPCHRIGGRRFHERSTPRRPRAPRRRPRAPRRWPWLRTRSKASVTPPSCRARTSWSSISRDQPLGSVIATTGVNVDEYHVPAGRSAVVNGIATTTLFKESWRMSGDPPNLGRHRVASLAGMPLDNSPSRSSGRLWLRRDHGLAAFGRSGFGQKDRHEKKEPRLVETGVLKVHSAWLRGGDSNP